MTNNQSNLKITDFKIELVENMGWCISTIRTPTVYLSLDGFKDKITHIDYFSDRYSAYELLYSTFDTKGYNYRVMLSTANTDVFYDIDIATAITIDKPIFEIDTTKNGLTRLQYSYTFIKDMSELHHIVFDYDERNGIS